MFSPRFLGLIIRSRNQGSDFDDCVPEFINGEARSLLRSLL